MAPTVRDEGHVNMYGLIHQSVLGSCAIISQMSLLLAGWRQVCFPQLVKLSSQCTGCTEGFNVTDVTIGINSKVGKSQTWRKKKFERNNDNV